MHLRAQSEEDACRSDPAGSKIPPPACFCAPGRVSPAALVGAVASSHWTRPLRTGAGAPAAAAGDLKSVNFRNSRAAPA